MNSDIKLPEKFENQNGIIGYWKPLEKYTIIASLPGFYDSQYTCIVTGDLPEELKEQGIRVVFSGQIYRDDNTPKPRMGGEQVFWLRLEAIRKA